MKKSQLFIDIDLAKGPGHSINTEVLMKLHPDGTQEILERYVWKDTIDLPTTAYKVKETAR